MVTKGVVVTGSGDETATRICDRNPSRCVLVIMNTSGDADMHVSDTVGIVGALIVPMNGGILELLATEGYDVTQEYRAYMDDLGTDTAVVMEQFMPDAIMRKLEEKGITTTQGLSALILLAGLIV
jgi:hypothetical protein